MTIQESANAPVAYRVGDAIGFGWKRSWRNFWWLLLVSVILTGISIVLNAVFTWQGAPQYDLTNPGQMDMGQMLTGSDGMSGFEVVLAFVGFIIQFIVTSFFALGVVRIGLAVSMGDRVRISHLFSFNGYGRYLASSILVGLLVGAVAGILIVIGAGITIATNQIAWVALFVLVAIFGAFIVSLFFCLFAYAILGENAPNISGLGRSWALVKPRFWAILGMQILLGLIVIGVFVAAIILGVLALCFGLIVTIPIAITLTLGIPTFAYAYAYRTLSGQPVA